MPRMWSHRGMAEDRSLGRVAQMRWIRLPCWSFATKSERFSPKYFTIVEAFYIITSSNSRTPPYEQSKVSEANAAVRPYGFRMSDGRN